MSVEDRYPPNGSPGFEKLLECEALAGVYNVLVYHHESWHGEYGEGQLMVNYTTEPMEEVGVTETSWQNIGVPTRLDRGTWVIDPLDVAGRSTDPFRTIVAETPGVAVRSGRR